MRLFKPILAGVRSGDRLLACFGASFSIAFSILVCSTLPLHGSDFPLVVAPLGASAVLVFTVPSSPMAQPWPVIGGNIVSTMIGVVIYQAIPNMELAASIAVPVGINSATLVVAGWLFHRLTSHSYPHRPAPATDAGLHLADIDAALEDMHEIFDISREDLDALLSRAEMHAAKRKAT